MSICSNQIITHEPESNWHLCSYRGWLIAVLPWENGFMFEYLSPDGESHGADECIHPDVTAAIRQAKSRIKRRATIGLMDQWLCEMQEQGIIDMQDYCRLFQSLH